MNCPQCKSEVDASAETCFHCGHVLRAPTQTLRKGSLIADRYEIISPLGKGGMGVVYKARDHKLEEFVAVKVLRPEVAADADMERRFRTEIRLARRVRHRNVCGIYEFGEDKGLRFIAMEYLEGTDLRRVLNERGALPLDQAFEICIRVSEGLQAIHEAGIIHRDLKTANLLIDSHGVVRLMDFGIAKQAGGEATMATSTGLIIGTPEYMSPEQARGEKIDFRSDIYSLGVLTYEIFTGHVPFRGDTPIATIFKHLQQPPPLEGDDVKGLPAELLEVLRHALAKTADERYATAADYAQALMQARDAAGIPPYSGSPTTPYPAAQGSGPFTPVPGHTPSRPMAGPATGAAPTLKPPPTVSGPRTAGPPIAVPPPVPVPPVQATVMQPRPEAAPVSPTRVARAPRKSSLPLVAVGGGVAAVVVLGVIGALLMRGRTNPATGTLTVPTTAPVTTLPALPSPAPVTTPASAAPAGKGLLVVDALPWGEVVSVTDASGQKVALDGSRYTPLALTLAPGAYAVELRQPGPGRTLILRGTVSAGGVERLQGEFQRVDVEAYFKRTGS